MAAKDFWEFVDDFMGHRVYSATPGSNVGHNWLIVDTSSSGTPTYAPVDGSDCGELKVDFDNQGEVQNVCVAQGNILQYNIDKITEVEFRVKMNQATKDSTTTLAFGVTGDRHDTIDSIAQAALFRLAAGTASNAIVVETDDGTTDLDDKPTGMELSDTYRDFKISFACGKGDVRFFIDGQPVATNTTFDMSAYSGSLQLFMQIQKSSDDNTDGFTVDRVAIRGRR